MARKEARPIARAMFRYNCRALHEDLTHEEKISLSQRVGYITRAIDFGRIRARPGNQGGRWPLKKIRNYAENLRVYISNLKAKYAHPSVELSRLELFSTELSNVL